jgi:hypothetical protein
MMDPALAWMAQSWAARPGNGALPAAAPVTPTTQSIVVAGASQVVFPAATIPSVADVINPASATESLFLDITGTGAAVGSGIELVAGQAYRISSPLPVAVSVTAATAGHVFRAVAY